LSEKPARIVSIVKKEGALLAILLFGAYGGNGYAEFFGILSSKIRGGDLVAWFLVLSPYFGWQCLRLIAYGWRTVGKT
jgi:hypothetical protein